MCKRASLIFVEDFEKPLQINYPRPDIGNLKAGRQGFAGLSFGGGLAAVSCLWWCTRTSTPTRLLLSEPGTEVAGEPDTREQCHLPDDFGDSCWTTRLEIRNVGGLQEKLPCERL